MVCGPRSTEEVVRCEGRGESLLNFIRKNALASLAVDHRPWTNLSLSDLHILYLINVFMAVASLAE